MTFKDISDKVKAELQLLSKPVKYVLYALCLLSVLGIGSCMLKGCSSNKAAIYSAGTEYPQAVQQAPQQVIIQQPSSGPHVGSLIAGAAVGALAHKALSRPVAPRTVIIKKYYSPSKSYRRRR